MEINDIHKIIHKEQYFSSIMKEEEEKQNKTIIEIIRSILTQSRSFCLLNTRYPTINKTDILELMSSPMFTRLDNKIYQNSFDLPFSQTLNADLNNLAGAVFHYMPMIVESTCDYFHHQNTDLPIHPCNRLISFYAAVFQGLFGYCWNKEQGEQCVYCLVMLIMKEMEYISRKTTERPVVSTSLFINSFCNEIIKQFILVSGVQSYLSGALMKLELDIINEPNLIRNPNDTELLAKYSKEIVKALSNNIMNLPPILFLFFQKIHIAVMNKFPDSPDEWKILTKSMFFEFLVQPAIITPKIYEIFPLNYFAQQPAHLKNIVKVISYAFEFRKPTEEFLSYDIGGSEIQLMMNNIIRTKVELNLPSLNQIIKDFNPKKSPHLFSPSDLILIAHIINNSKVMGGQEHFRSLCAFEAKLDYNIIEFCDFWYDNLKFDKNNGPENVVEPIVIDELTSVSNYFIAFLKQTDFDPNTPLNIDEFIDYHYKKSMENKSKEEEIIIHSLRNKMNLIQNNYEILMNKVKENINQLVQNNVNELSSMIKNQEVIQDLELMNNNILKHNEMQRAILFQSIILLFFHLNEEYWDELINRKGELMLNSSEWITMFNKISTNLIQNFASDNGIGKTYHHGINMHLHSYIISCVFPLNDFIIHHQKEMELGKKLKENIDFYRNHFLNDESNPENLRKLLNDESYLKHAILTLKYITKIGAPIEMFNIICYVVKTLQKVYSFETEQECTCSDFLPLIIFTSLESSITEIFVVKLYIQHFLTSAGKPMFFDRASSYIFASFISAIDILYTFVENNPPLKD